MERAKRQKELASGGGSSMSLLSGPAASNASMASASAAEIAKPGRAWGAAKERKADTMRRLKEDTEDDDGAELLRASPNGHSAARKARVPFLMAESPAIERAGR